MLCIEGLKKSSVLTGVDLKVKQGEITLLLGASGVGKSTLLRLICGLETADSGTINLDNKPLQAVGMIYQQFHLFEHLTVTKNLSLVLEQFSDNIDEGVDSLLNEYELTTQANQLAGNLSGGQKQRLAIARSIAARPQVLCMDEPTSALDPIRTRKIAEVIKTLSSNGLHVIITTHDLSLVEMLPCTLHLMDAGTIVESIASSKWIEDHGNAPLITLFTKGKSL